MWASIRRAFAFGSSRKPVVIIGILSSGAHETSGRGVPTPGGAFPASFPRFPCRSASSFASDAGSTGLVRWWSNPASSALRLSSSWPHPVSATMSMSWPQGSDRMRAAAS